MVIDVFENDNTLLQTIERVYRIGQTKRQLV